ncbi:MAG TPA: SxtJ family membrane protein [Longimicrobiaceae bacterium]|nr:SxtJ family membrane protein [Longimicrobiaceae bacterium]
MELIGLLGLVLLTLAGYSAGAVLAVRGRPAVPAAGDLLAAVLLCAAAIVFLDDAGRWVRFPAAVAGAALAGVLGAPLRSHDKVRLEAPEGGAWRRFAHAMGGFQGRLLLGLLYCVLVPPFALVARLRGDDPLAAPGEGSRWRARPAPAVALDEARRQG